MDRSSNELRLIAFLCPVCKQEIEVSMDGAGHRIECPACGNSIIVPKTTDPALSEKQKQSMKSRTIRIDLDDNW